MGSIYYMILLSSLVLFVSCKDKQAKETSSDRVFYAMEEKSSDGLQRMQNSQTEQTVVWNGKNYRVTINRVADESLPKITDEVGNQFVDNTITLSIKREDGGQLFQKAFTKQSFASVLDEAFVAHAMLEGLVYDKITAQGMVFAASVSYPQTDLFVPVAITISSNGSMTLRKEVSLGENETDGGDL